jgi:DNA-binding response OmpR family regulator
MTERSARIVIVDDDAELRGLLLRFLGEHGFHVRAVDSGKALDAALMRDPADVIVLDLMLPGEDGLAICRRLRADGDPTPIIMLTARGDPVDRVLGLEMGADDYLGKPFLPRELVARLAAILRRVGPSVGFCAMMWRGWAIHHKFFRCDGGTGRHANRAFQSRIRSAGCSGTFGGTTAQPCAIDRPRDRPRRRSDRSRH